jgi:methylated-DNA-protein-cysteine methyltransferase-like protein
MQVPIGVEQPRLGLPGNGYNLAMPKTTQPSQASLRIRRAIMKIPRGKVSSYGAVAAAAGIPRGARLAVRVLNQSHGLPWHRVVAAGGRIALPGEHGLDQRFRLEMEGVKFSGRKVRMAEFEFKFRATAKKKAVRKKRKA